MKTIATAAVFLTLTASAWADEAESKKSSPAIEPIVLSEAEMDGVTAGTGFGTFSISERDRRQSYAITPSDYRERWNLSSSYPYQG